MIPDGVFNCQNVCPKSAMEVAKNLECNSWRLQTRKSYFLLLPRACASKSLWNSINFVLHNSISSSQHKNIYSTQHETIVKRR